jgi:mono/diheme cytochrome c family protein
MPQVASLGHCAACHGRTIGTNLFANTQASHIAFPTTSAAQAEQIIAHKVSSAAWQEYQAARE